MLYGQYSETVKRSQTVFISFASQLEDPVFNPKFGAWDLSVCSMCALSVTLFLVCYFMLYMSLMSIYYFLLSCTAILSSVFAKSA